MQKLLILFIICFSTVMHAKANPTSQATQKKLAALSVTIENLKKKIEIQKQKEAQTLQQLEHTQKKLNQATQTLKLLNTNISQKKNRLTTLTQNTQSLKEKQVHSKAVLTKIIQLQFENHQQKNNILTLYGNQSNPKPHLYYYYVKAQEAHIKQLIEQLNNYAILQQTVEQEKIALDTLQSEVVYQNNKLQQEKFITQNTVLPQINKERIQNITQLNNKIDEQKQLELLLKKLREQTTFFAPNSRLNTSQKFAKAAGKLSLPIHQKGARLISNAQSKFIIPSQEGTDVHAIYPGRIIFAEFLRGLGLLIIIDHGEGYMSLYGNNQILYKKTGDWVNIHEKIAIVGNNGGKPNAGLYFEIRKDGRALNLRKWIQSA